MRKHIFPRKDSTIYKAHSIYNVGLDSIIELYRSTSSNPSRILIQFDTASLVGNETGSIYYLNLTLANANNLTMSPVVEVYPLSSSWSSGIGLADDADLNGVTWIRRLDNPPSGSSESLISASLWITEGGDYLSASGTSITYEVQDRDLKVDVTDIVNDWLTGSYDNNGFLIKFESDLVSGSSEHIQFYSMDTQTVYLPTLEQVYDDSLYVTSSDTGSWQEITSDKFSILMSGFKPEYKYNTTARFRLKLKELYQRKDYYEILRVGLGSYISDNLYYEIRDEYSDKVMAPFSEYTKVSFFPSEALGHYFNLDLSGYMPGRFYRINFKYTYGGIDTYLDRHYIFKVVK